MVFAGNFEGGNLTKTQEKFGKIMSPDKENKGEGKTEQNVILKEEQSSPRGVLSPNCSNHSSSSFGGSESSSSSSFEKVARTRKENHGLIWKNLVQQVKKRSVKLSNIPFLGGYEFAKKNMRKLGRIRSAEQNFESGDFVMPKPSWWNFTYQELVEATDNFSSDKLVGQGGHAKVYKGSLPNGQTVAVKKITKTDKNQEDRVADFLSELGIIAHINHTNTAKLIGFSIDDGALHLVLQFIHHGSLATALHGAREPLEWKIRYRVAVGVAEGLHYLHYECQRRIIHRDITASNILLSEDYEPQISDFGLAKWLPENWAHHAVSPIEGTFGYMAPEYFMHGIVYEKTDVFAFGVLPLEIITGRLAVDSCRQSLVMWAKPFLDQKNAKEIADPRLGEEYDKIEMRCVMATASACLHHLPNMRPTMIKVVQFLKGENELIELKTRSSGGRALLVDSYDLEDYTCTTYLNDLNRHMQLVME